jgi:hypothetical protein
MSVDEHRSVNDVQAIDLIVEHLSSLFPRVCSTCGRRFESLRDFFVQTTAIGTAISFDVELGDLRPKEPLGAMAMSNCQCGTTLALTSEGMPLPQLWSVLHWANVTAQARGISTSDFLQYARSETRKKVLGGGSDELSPST